MFLSLEVSIVRSFTFDALSSQYEFSGNFVRQLDAFVQMISKFQVNIVLFSDKGFLTLS